MDQNTPEWHLWRKKGIGSSDASIIMGVNKYKTIKQLWLEKTDQVQPKDETNYITERGKQLEPLARHCYELQTAIPVTPICCIHESYDYIKASLDGWNEERKLILEIKCPMKANHEMAMSGIIPINYYWQMVHQKLATKATEVHYFSFDGSWGELINVTILDEDIDKLLTREVKFWQCVIDRCEPQPEDFYE